MQIPQHRGFTLIELAMVITLLSVIFAVMVPNLIDIRTDARNGATKGALAGLRSSIAVVTAAIALREDPSLGTPKYPTLAEMRANAFNGSHPVLNGSNIMDAATGIPINPWSVETIPTVTMASISDCNTLAKSIITSGAGGDIGWCYRETSGQVWANSTRNGNSIALENGY